MGAGSGWIYTRLRRVLDFSKNGRAGIRGAEALRSLRRDPIQAEPDVRSLWWAREV